MWQLTTSNKHQHKMNKTFPMQGSPWKKKCMSPLGTPDVGNIHWSISCAIVHGLVITCAYCWGDVNELIVGLTLWQSMLAASWSPLAVLPQLSSSVTTVVICFVNCGLRFVHPCNVAWIGSGIGLFLVTYPQDMIIHLTNANKSTRPADERQNNKINVIQFSATHLRQAR